MEDLLISLGLKKEELILPGVVGFSVGLGVLYRIVPFGSTVKIRINLFFGVLALLIAFPLHQFAILFGTAVLGYFISVSSLPPRTATCVSLSILSLFHIERMINDYMTWSYDFTGPLMLIVVRLSTFSYHLYDGQHAESPHASSHSAIRNVPDLLTYLSYIFNIFTVVAGPCLSFQQYIAGTSSPVSPIRAGSLAVPLANVLVAASLGKLQVHFPMLSVDNWFEGGKESGHGFLEFSLGQRVCIVYVSLLLVRMRYYLAWNLAEIACTLGGLSPNGEASNANMFSIELGSTSIAQAAGRWNKTVSHWLKHYIYRRASFKSKTANMILTRAVSAFWHGFYPGYYLTFLFLVLGDLVEGRVRRLWISSHHGRSQNIIVKCASAIIGWAATFFSLSYYGAPFFVLSLDRGLEVWRRMAWIGHVVHLAILVLIGVFAGDKPHGKVGKVHAE